MLNITEIRLSFRKSSGRILEWLCRLSLGVLLLLIFNCVAIFGQAQDMTDNLKSKWLLKFTAGYNIPLSKTGNTPLTTRTIMANESSFALEYVSTEYFFAERMGIEFSYSDVISFCNCFSRYVRQLESFYLQQNLYVTPEYRLFQNEIGRVSNSVLLIGPIWKFPIDRFIFKPKVLIGRSSFVAETIGVLLKEKNSNTYYHLTLEPLSTRYKPFTYSLGFSSGYYLTKGLIFNLDLRYTGIMTDIVYRQTTTELGNSRTTRATHNIRKTMHIFTPGIGLSIAIL